MGQIKQRYRHRDTQKYKNIVIERICHNPCLVKNETLSINKYVVLSDFSWMIIFIITFQVRYMPRLCRRRLNLCMPQNVRNGHRISITNSTPNGVISLQMVNGSVLNKDIRRKTQGSSSHLEVLATENRGRSKKKRKRKEYK
ncbi:hypothetical protein CR513_18036, partial [Mucuna pruriens]